MTSQDFILFSMQFAAMLAVAIVFGQLMRRLKQPAVLGEMLGGIVLGPTIFGALSPALYEWLFHSSPDITVVRDASIKMGMLFFLFVAGLETNLSDLRTIGKRATLIGLVGTLLPIAAGVGLVYLVPRNFWGPLVQPHFLAFALFIGMNLANSANPVIARVLMDLGLMKTTTGTTIMAATIFDDLINWTLFAFILSEVAPASESGSSAGGISLPISILLVLGYFIVVLVIGRWLGPPLLRWIKRHVSWPTGLIGITTLIILVASSIAENLGIHAFLGAFLVGVALSGDDPEQNAAHEIISRFVLSIFAPIYFVSMGLNANFFQNFDLSLVVILLAAACISKIGAVLLGARLASMKINRESLAIAFGLNARGATGIILAGVGLANGMIDERIFVAIVIMAVITSLMSGPAMKSLLSERIAMIRTSQEQEVEVEI